MQTGGDQHVGIGFRFDVIVRAVRFHIAVVNLILRIPPLFKLPGRQRNGFIEHGRHHIDKRHLRDNPLKAIGTLVDNRPHQHAARAAAHAKAELRIAIALLNQRIADVEVVIEGVFLFQEFPVLIPVLPQLTAAANMGDGEDKAAVEQA